MKKMGDSAQDKATSTYLDSLNAEHTSEIANCDDAMNQSEEDFFHHLNLSKCTNGFPNLRPIQAAPVRKYPLTRYTHQSIMQSNKRPRTESVAQKSNAVMKRVKGEKKRRTLSQKIIQLKQTALKKLQSESTNCQEIPMADGVASEYECKICEFKHTSKNEYEKHMNSLKHILKTEMEKSIDKDILDSEKKLKTQLSPNLPCRCSFPNCSAEFVDWDKFIQHDREHKNIAPFKCIRCEAKFTNRTGLVCHLKRHLGIKNMKCEQCDKVFEKHRDLVSHLTTIHHEKDVRERNFKCTECGDAFLTKQGVDRHMRWHTGYRPETCHFCGANFHSQFDLKQHIRIHSGEKPYNCDECDYKARTLQLLKRHKRKHNGEKPLSCKECEFTCSNSSALKRHTRLHSGAKPYKCPYCSHRCSNIENLRKHIKKVKKHAGLNIYRCSHCMSYSTDRGNEYLRHMKQYHFPYLDLKSVTATKLAGILVDDNSQDDAGSENDEDATSMSEESLFGHDSLNLNSIQQSSNMLPELGLKATMETLNENDLRCLDPQIVNQARLDRGDVFLLSTTPPENNEPCKEGTFSASVPFDDESCMAETFETTRADTNIHQPIDPISSEVNLSQGYLAVLVKWPNDQKVEVQQAPVEGVPLTLVVNSSPVYLKPADDYSTEKSIVNNISETDDIYSKNGSKTYIMSPNGLVLANGRGAKDTSTRAMHSASFEPISADKTVLDETPKSNFMTKSSIHVPDVPPNILTVTPEKDKLDNTS